MCKKREDYIEWCEYFMAVAFLSAQRSKDPSSQLGQGTAGGAVPASFTLLYRQEKTRWQRREETDAACSQRHTQDRVGACIVNPENKIVGIGYNGMPNGCPDDVLPWARTAEDRLDTKYPYVCHAELNAIMNKNSADVKGCVMYVALFPCNECAKLIIQAGIKEVIFMSDKYHDSPEMKAARRMFELSGVQYTKFVPKRKSIVIDFDSINKSRPSPTQL
ncbi:deoxycytidylate deaminase isoform X2 [Pyxicephalus adspersus]